MNIITISQLNYSIGIEDILSDVSCTVNAGDRIGIVGVNGAGKSTLLRLIMGEYDPSHISDGEYLEKSSGSISFAGDIDIAYLRQREHFKPGTSVWNSLDVKIDPAAFEEKNSYSLEKGKRGILTSLGFGEDSYDQDASSLSGGEQTRLALGAVLLKDPQVLLLDEPTNHLDLPTLSWLENRLKACRSTLIIVSHDRYFLDNIADRIFEIENGKLTVYSGNYTQYKERKQILYDEALKHYNLQQEEIRRQEELITRWHERNTEHLVKRAQSREKRLAMIERLEKPVLLKEQIKLSFKQNLQTGNDVFIIEGLSFSYEVGSDDKVPARNSGAAQPGGFSGPEALHSNHFKADYAGDEASSENFLISDFDAVIKKGERIVITGPNGCGKTTLLKMIMGELRPLYGRIKYGTNVIPAYYDQQQENLNPSNTVLDELYNSKGILVGPGEYIKIEARYNQTELRRLLGAMCFTGDDVFKTVGSLAGGEKARLSLLKLMMSGANVLILDEPTNHLDIASKEVFEDALLAFPGTEIIVSHDRYFIEKVATRTIDMTGTEKKAEYAPPAPRREIGELGYIKGSEEERQAKKKIAAGQKRRERLAASLEERISLLEEKKSGLENQLCEESVFSDAAKAMQLTKELEAVKAELDEIYVQWMETQE